MTPQELDQIILAYAKAADGIGCERGSFLYDEIARGLTAVIPQVVAAEREQCAIVADRLGADDTHFSGGHAIASAIRNRSADDETSRQRAIEVTARRIAYDDHVSSLCAVPTWGNLSEGRRDALRRHAAVALGMHG